MAIFITPSSLFSNIRYVSLPFSMYVYAFMLFLISCLLI